DRDRDQLGRPAQHPGRRARQPGESFELEGTAGWFAAAVTESNSSSAMIMLASAALFRKRCPKQYGNAVTCTFCAMLSTICRARPTMIACRSCAGFTTDETHKKRDRTWRRGC